MDSPEKKNQWIHNWFSFLKQPRSRNQTTRHSWSSPSQDDTPSHPLTERRSSQQTTATTVTTTSSFFSDDDQTSTPPLDHRQKSDERFRIKSLWTKARKRQSNNHPRSSLLNRTSRRQHSPTLCDNRESIRPFNGPPPPPPQRQQLSCGEFTVRHHRSCQEFHKKRHSITSLTSGDRSTATSRPASAFYSRPASPALTKDDKDDDNDLCISDDCKDPRSLLPGRWAVKPELVQLAMDNSLFCSPFDISSSAGASEKHVLHVGCGDGFWGARVAMEYPKWTVVAVDDRLSFDKRHMALRKNLKLLRDPDVPLVEHLQRMPDQSYDLVHCQFLNLSLTVSDYRDLLQQCWRVCKPGGYVEVLEMDMRIYFSHPSSGTTMQAFNSEAIHVMESRSLDPDFASQLHTMVTSLCQPGDNFRALHHGNYASLPLGLWGGRIGVMFRDDFRDLFERFHPLISENKQVNPYTERELGSVLECLNVEMDLHRAYMNLHYTFAQKADCK